MIAVKATVKNNLLQPLGVLLPPTKAILQKRETISNITSNDIAWLWVSLTKVYGYRFISNYGEKDDGIWLDALKGLSRDDLDYGFKKMLATITDAEWEKREAWPPNVKEFRMYCERRLKDFDLPEVHEAFSEVKNSNYLSRPFWSHPLVSMAKNKLGKKRQAYVMDEDYPQFQSVYLDLCQRFMRGEAMNVLGSSEQ